MKFIKCCLFILLIIQSLPLLSNETISIPSGKFTPMYGIEKNQKDFSVKSFKILKFPISENEFATFLSVHPEWRKENVKSIFVDKKYLINSLDKHKIKKPMTYVSWFAANAYCRFVGGRLPTTLEWEYVAAASEKKQNATDDSENIDKLLRWYSKPNDETEKLIIGNGKANWYGVHDMHGLVWEWTSDFNSVFITSDNRQDGDKEKGLFCGGSSIGARSKEDYAAFVRYSLRGSLQANYTIENLGFRCVYDN